MCWFFVCGVDLGAPSKFSNHLVEEERDGVEGWERADLLALVCGVYCEFVTFPLVYWVRCGT